MELTEILKKLCIKDLRNPDNESWLYDEWDEKQPEPRKNCFCDNCFYGRDELALEILKLRNHITKEI